METMNHIRPLAISGGRKGGNDYIDVVMVSVVQWWDERYSYLMNKHSIKKNELFMRCDNKSKSLNLPIPIMEAVETSDSSTVLFAI